MDIPTVLGTEARVPPAPSSKDVWCGLLSKGQGSSEVFLLESYSGPLSLASDEGCRRADPAGSPSIPSCTELNAIQKQGQCSPPRVFQRVWAETHRRGPSLGQTLAFTTACGQEKKGGVSSKTGSPGPSHGPLRSASLRAWLQGGLRPSHEGTGV
uniref:Uncharacterized protein n=1 Tax=Pipistrellus kuhlii TaxID=59472 RepID=A0A7J7XV21_PIPKU|nr:hypothetical protein mPipKuh1_010466 [Pipistrellus kuhlii]